jgi:hypothetical protein
LSIGLALFCTLLFIRLLGLPLPLTGPWLSIDHWSPGTTAPTSTAIPPAALPTSSQ